MTPAIRYLQMSQIPFDSHSYDCDVHEDFGRHAADQLGLPAEVVYKTLLIHQEKQVVVAIIPVDCHLNLKDAAKAAGLKKVEMLKPAEAERLTGYKVGGISPFAQKKKLPTLLDRRALAQEKILVSGGKRGLSVGLTPADLVRSLSATVAAIAE
ncbi:Cys-tRNA(Pro) deacylase [Pseudaeromonas sp. ZJS20]|uniref:Cys-tRNA(Pro) deacylase n=1 Tax=Pseudaeromonas aegiceratis TaxID=3153928 RepID=UPI00390C982F